MRGEPKDLRSTGRKRLRAVLLKEVAEGRREFHCECVDTTHPKHPTGPCGYIPPGQIGRSNNLDANHKNKDLNDCDPANGEWLCRSCHALSDRVTEKGVSKVDTHGYGDLT
jgi:hypothetical protein